MGVIQPKPFLESTRLRNMATGVDRRRNMSKIMMLKSAYFPLPINYDDIDREFVKFVEKELEISYDGVRVPTIRLFSNQRLSEYSQTWEQSDANGNILMNFKTVTRENTPQKGENQGSNFNIPGERYYPMYYVPELQENGTTAYNVYEMKQPFAVDFIYTIGLITNKYELINQFNNLVLSKFKANECYLWPNEHPMPMFLDSISDESEYGIDNRKYYSQSFKIKLNAYIIREDDFRVTKLPSKLSIKIGPKKDKYANRFKLDTVGTNVPTWKEERTYAAHFDDGECVKSVWDEDDSNVIHEEEHSLILDPIELSPVIVNDMAHKPLICGDREDDYFDDFVDEKGIIVDVSVEEDDDCCAMFTTGDDDYQDERYKHVAITVSVNFPVCRYKTSFTIDQDVDIQRINTDNIFDFLLKINGKRVSFSDTIHVKNGDEIVIKTSKDDIEKPSTITLYGTDPNRVYDSENIAETVLDEEVQEEIIDIDVE